MSIDDYLTMDEVAKALNVDISTISRRLKRENLEVKRVGRYVYIPPESALQLGLSWEQINEILQKKKKAKGTEEEHEEDLIGKLFADINVKEFNSFGSASETGDFEEKEGGDTIPQNERSRGKKKTDKGVRASKDALKPVEKLLGESYAKTLVPTLESLEWWNTAKELIAWHSIMIALQVAKVDPQEIIRKAEEFRDPVKFANYIKELLSAMVEAIDDASVIQQYREELEDTQRQLEACLLLLDKQAERIKELEADISFALQRLSRKDLLEFYVWKGFIQPSILFGGKVGVDYGSGGGSDEEIS